MYTASPPQQFTLELKELLGELRRRKWTLIRWGAEDAPDLLAALFSWQFCTDVLIIRNPDEASAYRAPTMHRGSGAFNPPSVAYQYHSSPTWTLRAILGLPEPGGVGAPMGIEVPSQQCMVPAPEDLPKPVVVRPL